MNIYENGIIQINFFHKPWRLMHDIEAEREEERLVSVGKSDDHVRNDGGRVVNFHIDAFQQLIGVTWMELSYFI